jgi:hypothetical protein
MTERQPVGRHVGQGFVVISEATQLAAGVVRCGGCESTMSNNSLAREGHARTCAELQRLRSMADRAFRRAHPEAEA